MKRSVTVEIECDGKNCGKCKFLTKYFAGQKPPTKRCMIFNMDKDLVEDGENVERDKLCLVSEI